MAINVPQYNTILDPNMKFTRAFYFYEDDGLTPVNVSTWSFRLDIFNSSDVLVVQITNTAFLRPATNAIQFSKSISEVVALPDDLYHISLKATNGTEFSEDEILNGFWRK